MNPEDIRIGLIGCGGIGAIHSDCVAQTEGARMFAFADVDTLKATELCARYAGEYSTTDPATLLADDRLDAVYIATRHDSHADLAVAACRAGKHVMIEKPLALSETDLLRIEHAAAESSARFMPAFKLRFYPLVLQAREFIPNPTLVVGQMMDARWGDDHWAQDPHMGGGNVHSQGCHTADLMRFFTGADPAMMWAGGGTVTHPDSPTIDQCIATIRFDNGAVGAWIQGDAALPAFTSKHFFQLLGPEGRSVQIYSRMTAATFSDGERTWSEQRPEEEGFLLETREFISALRENRAPSVSVRDGVQATRMTLAAETSIRTGEVWTPSQD